MQSGSVWITDKSVVQKEFSDELKVSKSTIFAGVPYTFEILRRLEYQPLINSNLKKITQAGGRLGLLERREVYELSERIGAKFFIMYGQTEATARISCFCVNQYPNKIGSVGRPLSNVSVETSNEGELFIKGPSVTPGYITEVSDFISKESRLQHETGDIGRLDNDGFIYIEGRISRFSKIAGKRLNLDIIESELEKFYAKNIYVVSDDNKLFIATQHWESDTKKPLIQGVHPTKIKLVTIKDVPLTSNGKVDHRLLSKIICNYEY